MAVCLVLLAALAAAPASAAAHAAGTKDFWIGADLSDWLIANMPPTQITIGILIGLVGGEILRAAWRTIEWLLFTVYVFARVTARYGALAAIAGCILYFL